ncbi:MAG: hypothetical protein Q9210_006145 [Variospora velana]
MELAQRPDTHGTSTESDAETHINRYREVPHVNNQLKCSLDLESTAPAGGNVQQGTPTLSLEDFQAAHVLENLRVGDALHLPASSLARSRQDIQNDDLKMGADGGSLPPTFSTFCQDAHEAEPEPLLSLFTSQHPLLSTAINGSLSAYTTSKSFSPCFKYSAELVEKHIGHPVVSTVTAASRLSGADSAARRWLEREPRTQEGRYKRRRTGDDNSEERDVERGYDEGATRCEKTIYRGSEGHAGRDLRDLSHPLEHRDADTAMSEPLPPYDPGGRSPRYDPHDPAPQPGHPRPQGHPSWRTQLATSTSGLGVALSEESLRSLRYCLSWLRRANGSVGSMTNSLKDVIQEHHVSSQNAGEPPPIDADGDGSVLFEPKNQATKTERLRFLKSGILDTISKAVDIVSMYAGGALPANARNLVRSHIMSLPARYFSMSPQAAESFSNHNSSMQAEETPSAPREQSNTSNVTETSTETSTPSPKNEVKSAQRVVVLAIEALDMMTQISVIVSGVIQSAENWLDRFGRRPRGAATEDQQTQRKQRPNEGGTPQILLDEKEHMKLIYGKM